jgi:hypothetical protein
MYPDFLVIGAQKAGTTWLHRNLQAHPGIWMPQEKELHYFDEKVKLKSNLYDRLRGSRPADVRWRRQIKSQLRRYPKELSRESLSWNLRYFLGRYNDQWYASLFEQGKGHLTGEVTPDYSILERETVAYVHDLMPEARIVFMMRSPIERAWSVTEMGLRSRGRSPDRVRDRRLYRRLDNRRVRLFSDYRRTLETWGEFYPEEQIFIGFLEDIHFHPQQLLQSVFTFLDVDPSFKPRSPEKKVHSRSVGRMPSRFATHLARSYKEEIGWLEERFGGYGSFWAYCGRRLVEEPPEGEEIAYPLYEGVMWEEWEGSGSITLQSGPLSSIPSTTG